MRDNNMLIADFIEIQNKKLSGTSYYNKRTDRFIRQLEGVSLFDDGTYCVTDLEKAWNETKSSNVYDDHGINSI
ncbi:hypothetical protein PE36_08021 [Moritella sp. PE36]|uniref:hypothetical protein n=1 Tax=Moritella sp. PE36 TaxID=58051 RepID=UPI0001568C88|nr:hypothetical protein [Moritella sp. PE36]EDM65932.1 hypothetical protein PE36_08021 [Moritella sp. PE36]